LNIYNDIIKVSHDTVTEKLSENLPMALAVHVLGFCSCNCFAGMINGKASVDENFLKRIYAYIKGI